VFIVKLTITIGIVQFRSFVGRIRGRCDVVSVIEEITFHNSPFRDPTLTHRKIVHQWITEATKQ
jgi:hypothetical protein